MDFYSKTEEILLTGLWSRARFLLFDLVGWIWPVRWAAWRWGSGWMSFFPSSWTCCRTLPPWPNARYGEIECQILVNWFIHKTFVAFYICLDACWMSSFIQMLSLQFSSLKVLLPRVLFSSRWRFGLWASRWLVQATWWSPTANTLPFLKCCSTSSRLNKIRVSGERYELGLKVINHVELWIKTLQVQERHLSARNKWMTSVLHALTQQKLCPLLFYLCGTFTRLIVMHVRFDIGFSLVFWFLWKIKSVWSWHHHALEEKGGTWGY